MALTRVKPAKPVHPHESLLRELFDRFSARDAEGMARCYHPDIFFSDPVFLHLHGDEVTDMWRMLLGRATDLRITVEEIAANAEGGRALWTARYSFGPSRRPVVNRVRSLFAFRDGRIVRHYDSFPFRRWASQAFGPVGAAFGWFSLFKWWVRRSAARRLEKMGSGTEKMGSGTHFR